MSNGGTHESKRTKLTNKELHDCVRAISIVLCDSDLENFLDVICSFYLDEIQHAQMLAKVGELLGHQPTLFADFSRIYKIDSPRNVSLILEPVSTEFL